ncbi:MAG: tRNA uridine-5-carboxymethylaminomethyl(34) synthesis GTPase MnmE [Gammaproteobacteria bacterium]
MPKSISSIIGQKEPICALATPPGKGALAIVRLSGRDAQVLANKITHKKLLPRLAHYTVFYDFSDRIIDQGLALFFQSPASFTGEDVVEFHCHGNPLVAELLLKTLCSLGARLATPGEFSLRAFLNNKIDLAQAEAIADLINSTTEQAARTATRSLQGAFSERVKGVLTQLVQVRMHIEAHLDFPDEEIDRQQSAQLLKQLTLLEKFLDELLQQAKLGERLQTGATIAIAGKPNAGKSSLLNVLAQSDVAIVTEIPGTTRDPLSADIEIQGIAVRLVDTAGLRETKDIVEAKGIERAQQALAQADLILWLTDVDNEDSQMAPKEIDANKIVTVHNKIDLQDASHRNDNENIYISAKNQIGIDDLIEQLGLRLMGDNVLSENGDTPFLARNRHVIALQNAQQNLRSAQQRLSNSNELELAAEDLRIAQQNLGVITGEFTPDDLLGKIFSEFCIGK